MRDCFVLPVLADIATDAAAGSSGCHFYATRRTSMNKKRIVVYTALIGDKESLGNPLDFLTPDARTDLEYTFICFTDRTDLQSRVWNFVQMDSSHLPADKLSRRPKALAHEYLQNWDYSLYIDNIVKFKRLLTSADLEHSKPYLLRMYRHLTRKTLTQEAEALVSFGYDEVNTLNNQIEFYGNTGQTDKVTPLSTGTVILRSHKHPQLIQLGVEWWEHILAFSKRDQMSFDRARMRAGCEVDYFDGTIIDNPMFTSTSNLENRVLSSFDEKRYYWKHRKQITSPKDSKKHFLATGAINHDDYKRKINLFEYLCLKYGSSLGSRVSPRRNVSQFLHDSLWPMFYKEGRMLLIHVKDSSLETGFLDQEFEPAAKVFANMLPRFKGQLMTIEAKDLMQASLVPNAGEPVFDFIVFFGVSPASLKVIPEATSKLVSTTSGAVFFLASEAVSWDVLTGCITKFEKNLAMAPKISLSPSWHDGVGGLFSSSAGLLSWDQG